MSNEAYRYDLADTFALTSLVEDLVYTKGDLWRPHHCSKPFDYGFRYTRESVKKAFPKAFATVEDALAAIREFMDPRGECVA